MYPSPIRALCADLSTFVSVDPGAIRGVVWRILKIRLSFSQAIAIGQPVQCLRGSTDWERPIIPAGPLIYDAPLSERPAPVVKPSNSTEHGLRSGV